MNEKLRISMVQMTSHNIHAQNVITLRAAAQKASEEDAEMLALPEAAGLMDRDKTHARAQITTEGDDPYISGCREVAAKHSIWVHSGSSPVKSHDGRYLNHKVLIASTGEIIARYDKVHLFDTILDSGAVTVDCEKLGKLLMTKLVIISGYCGSNSARQTSTFLC